MAASPGAARWPQRLSPSSYWGVCWSFRSGQARIRFNPGCRESSAAFESNFTKIERPASSLDEGARAKLRQFRSFETYRLLISVRRKGPMYFVAAVLVVLSGLFYAAGQNE